MRKYVESFARYGGVVAVVFEWLALVTFYLHNPSDFSGEHPISYFATLPQTRLVFSLCYTLAAISFWVFAKYHLNKHYQTPTKIFTLSMLGFAGVAIVPFSFTDTISSAIHSILAFTFSLGFLIGMYLMAKHNNDKQVRRLSIAAVIFSILLFIPFLLVKEGSQLTLIFEAGSGFICQLWTVWMSYYAYKKQDKSSS